MPEKSQPGQPHPDYTLPEVTHPYWDLNPPYFPGDGFSPNALGMAAGWGDGTLNFSMMPLQFDWISQNLDFDFANYGGLDLDK